MVKERSFWSFFHLFFSSGYAVLHCAVEFSFAQFCVHKLYFGPFKMYRTRESETERERKQKVYKSVASESITFVRASLAREFSILPVRVCDVPEDYNVMNKEGKCNYRHSNNNYVTTKN